LSGAFDEQGRVKLSERVKAIPPWPIVGYDMPRTLRGTVEKVLGFKVGKFYFSVRWLAWEERKIGGA
jgi:hypothetical protein